jgi:hypothetical protein
MPKPSTTTVPAPVTNPSTNGSHNSGATSPTTPVTGPATVPNTAPNGGGPGSSDGGGDHRSSTTTSFPATAGVRSYHSSGGSITVRIGHGSVTLLHVDPATGFTPETHDSGPDRVDVRFIRGGQTYRIELQVDGNGQVVRTSSNDGPG